MTEPLGLGDVNLHLVESVSDATEFMSWLGQRRNVLAVDTETEGLRHWSDHLRLVQFGDATDGWAIPWERWGGVALEALTRYDGPLVMHNAIFDVMFLEHWGDITLPHHRIDDTMTMAHLVAPDLPVGLKSLTERLIDRRAANAQHVLAEAMSQQRWTWATVPVNFGPYWAYGALDTVLTHRLHEILQPQVTTSYAALYDLEMAVQWIVMAMKRRGCRIDLPFVHDKRDALEGYADAITSWCERAHGVNPNSNQQVARRLLELGIELTGRTKTGQWKLDEDVLLGIDHELAGQVLQQRKSRKIVGTYLDNFIEMADGDLLHPDIRCLGTRTGRMSVTTPALQTLPRADEKNPQAIIVRDCFIPREGNTLVSIDYSQVEQRVLCDLTQDAGMIAAFNSGDDFFTAMAQRIYGDTSITKKDPRRQVTKNAAYCTAYGGGPTKFAQTAQISEAQGRAFLDTYYASYPGVRQFQQRVEQVARERFESGGIAYVKTRIGRYQPADGDKFYALVNYAIQATAADVLKQAIVQMDLAGLGEYMVLPIHDEILMDCPVDDWQEVAQTAKVAMEQHEGWAVSLLAEVAGPLSRWGKKV